MAKKLEKWPPKLTADWAFGIIDKIYRGYGKSVNVDLLPDILECTRASSNFSKRLYALQTFRLASVTKDVLTLTSLAMRIAAPISEVEKQEAKVESVSAIQILADLLNRFPGGHLPEESSLVNLLKREYEISDESVKDWVEFVTRSIQATKSRIQVVLENPSLTTQQAADQILSDEPGPSRPPSRTESANMMRVPLAGSRYILIPFDITDSEAEYFNKWYEMWKALHGGQ